MPDADAAGLRRAWRAAADDLAIRVTTEAPSIPDSDDTTHPVVAIVHDFGGEHGMAILAEYEPALAGLAQSSGYGFTVLGTSYESYRRDLFVDTLNDWQWCGEGEPPPWYTGRPWTE